MSSKSTSSKKTATTKSAGKGESKAAKTAPAKAAKAAAKPSVKAPAKAAPKDVEAPKVAAAAKEATAPKDVAAPKDVVAKEAAPKSEPKPAVVKQAVKAIAKAAPKSQPKKSPSPFEAGDFVVYPTHGVGKVLSIESQEISGITLDLIVIKFDKDRMTLRVPVTKAEQSGLRKLSSKKVMDSALATLKGRSRAKRTMWSRRAQEYEAKINSGDPISIAEVVRDLHRGDDQPEQSYSERQMYQAALDRLAREVAAMEQIDEASAALKLEKMLRAA